MWARTGRRWRPARRRAYPRAPGRAVSSALREAAQTSRRETATIPRPRHTVGLPARVQTGLAGVERAMKAVAVYNMKGGVGKTTAAVNLSYLAAASGQRALLWDLDPQAASSFAFRVRSRVAGFGRKSLERGRAFPEAVRETDYSNLDLLPADFAYR